MVPVTVDGETAKLATITYKPAGGRCAISTPSRR
jgi:hypothetical protein